MLKKFSFFHSNGGLLLYVYHKNDVQTESWKIMLGHHPHFFEVCVTAAVVQYRLYPEEYP